jgi:hypothetical protein
MTLPGSSLLTGAEGLSVVTRPDSVLTRLARSSLNQGSPATALQTQVDGLVTGFVQEASNPATLAALMAGGFAYRFGRIGIMAAGEGWAARSSSFLRALSVSRGFGLEVSSFEFTNRLWPLDKIPIAGAGEGRAVSTKVFGHRR